MTTTNRIIALAAAIIVFVGGLFTMNSFGATSVFQYFGGGTGTTTPNIGQLTWWGSTNLSGVATTSVSCSGGTSCSSFTAIGSSPITISSVSGISAYDAFSHVSYGGQTTSATTSTMWFTNPLISLAASSSVLTSASSTNLSALAFFQIPANTSPVVTANGEMEINTNSASSSINFFDGTAQRGIYDVTDVGFSFVNYPVNGTATTTLLFKGGLRGRTYIDGACRSNGAGTAVTQLGSGTASTTSIFASAAGTNNVTFSSNNVFQSWSDVQVAIGTFSSTGTTTVTCSYDKRYLY